MSTSAPWEPLLGHVDKARYQALVKRVIDPTRMDASFRELREQATMLVPGTGPLQPRAAVVGEAPGTVEDRCGVPFVGPSGQLLDRLLAVAGLQRHGVWITNLVKYLPITRAGEIRRPYRRETQAAIRYLKWELHILQPELVILCGNSAIHAVEPEIDLATFHGQPFSTGTRAYVPVYHPAACLRDESRLSLALEDFGRLRGVLEGRGWDLVPVPSTP